MVAAALPVAWRERLRAGMPTQCAVCLGWGTSRICRACRERHTRPDARCSRCALRVPPGQPVCGSCLRAPLPFEHAAAAVDYAFPWSGVIGALKFHHALDLAPALAALLADAARTSPLPPPDLLLPVPLSSQRLAERGHNQAWELARRAATMLGLAASPRWLCRLVDTAHQADLPRERRAGNVRGVFAVPADQAHRLRGRSVALVDDVMTTGATLAEAARVLRAAGASSVQAWVVARTPVE